MAAANPPHDELTPAIAHISPLLDATEAGRLLSVPASWVLAEARANRIPHVRLGRYVRFSADELEVWWRARMRGPWRARGVASRTARSVVADRQAQPASVATDAQAVSAGAAAAAGTLGDR
jgi:excisionase family DNA binding protein